MRKYFVAFIILLGMLFSPFIVRAEECDHSSITIQSMELVDTEGDIEEIAEPTYQDKTINFHLKMYNVGDSIAYDITIQNASNEDYMIDDDTFQTDSNYIEYILRTNDNNNVVKAKSSKRVTLTVRYKKEVEDSLLTNHTFDASNSLTLSMTTSEPEKEIDVITTDNPQDIKNPFTKRTGIYFILLVLFIASMIVYFSARKKKNVKPYLLLVLTIILIPTIHAVCKVEVDIYSSIEIEKKQELPNTIITAKDNYSCIIQYTSSVTDEVGVTKTATNVYYDRCEDLRNIIFGGFCWQIVRTTETGGTKIIYNGEPVDGKCESTRGNHKGIVAGTGDSKLLDSAYLYGSSFTYDTTTGEFTLVDTTTTTWTESNYKDLFGKYTCSNLTGKCTTLYNVNGYHSTNKAHVAKYTIEDTNYAQIGQTPYNADPHSIAMVSYMFNDVYNCPTSQGPESGSLIGNDVSYANGMYTLLPAEGETTLGTTLDSNHHYTCNNQSGTCATVRYYYLNNGFVQLSNGKKGEDAISDMLSSNDVNHYNSNIKALVDSWYAQNLISKTNMLEDVVFCNARTTINQEQNGWNPFGGELGTYYNFKNYQTRTRLLTCPNLTDQFAVSNSIAKLTYPVSLLQNEERNGLDYQSLVSTGSSWWTISPYFSNGVHYVNGDGSDGQLVNVRWGYGVRPVVSLKPGTEIASGSGSEIDPWIIKED